jgi:hypothetical protein
MLGEIGITYLKNLPSFYFFLMILKKYPLGLIRETKPMVVFTLNKALGG